ncbi:insulinase family protein [bacterium]|nr:insulinase family protein [bacterium]
MALTKLASRIRSVQLNQATAFVLPWEIDSVVSVCGSFSTFPSQKHGEEVIQDLMVSMLDKGTLKRSKIELSTLLEDCGANIHFSSAGSRIRFDAKCLKSDLELVIRLINEQLLYPLFDEAEFELLKGRVQAHVKRLESDTSSVAHDELSRMVYQTSHPKYALPLEEVSKVVASAERSDLEAYWSSHVGTQDFLVTIVGDAGSVAPQAVLTSLTEGLSLRSLHPAQIDWADPSKPLSKHVEISDRFNLDLNIGHRVNVLKHDSDYLPLSLGVFLLGGNFSSHLMGTIRDRDGLTYGIRSALSGIDRNHWGAWLTSVTLSQEKLQEGTASTIKEMSRFLEQKTTSEALELCKATKIGSYQLSLSTTGGIASILRSHHEDGYLVDRVDTYPSEIEAIPAARVDQAMSNHLHVDQLHVVSAGSALAT